MFHDGHLTKKHSAYTGTYGTYARLLQISISKTLEQLLRSKLSDHIRQFNMWQHELTVIKNRYAYI